MNRIYRLFCRVMLSATLLAPFHFALAWTPVVTSDGSTALARHESGAVIYDSKLFLLGGRSTNNLQVYDPASNTWTDLGVLPFEMHHFQPVEFNGSIYIIGSFSCCYPDETTNPEIYRYNIALSQWVMEGVMPANRLRGSAGTVVHNNKIYLVGGNTRGHNGGAVPWFDEYDPLTGNWKVLDDAPNARDHFMAVMVDNKLVATAGRQSARSAGNNVPGTDIYDFETESWTSGTIIPTPRSGAMTVSFNSRIFVIGGESLALVDSHKTAEALNLTTGSWDSIPEMLIPRHSGGAGVIGDNLHVVAGNATRGGGNEINNHEVINLTELVYSPLIDVTTDSDNDGITDLVETTIHKTDPNNADTDGDSLNDHVEITQFLTNPLTDDTDGDTVKDNDELNRGLDPLNGDTDNDSLSDGDEIRIHQTDPLSSDTDGDSLPDGAEVNQHNSNPTEHDTDNDNIPDGYEVNNLRSDPAKADSDNDGLRDDIEFHLTGTSPTNSDTDGDGLTDTSELDIYGTDPLTLDTDHDGVSDGNEIDAGSHPLNIDEDEDGLTNSADGIADSDGDGLPNYRDRDSDNDGVPDVVENGLTDVNFDGKIDTLEELEKARRVESEQQEVKTEERATPNDIVDRETRSTMTVVSSNPETIVLSAPKLMTVSLDEDGDGVPNFLDLDSDQDGISDYVESTANFTSNTSRNNFFNDTNNDGLDDAYGDNLYSWPYDTDGDGKDNYLDLDSDNDGKSDLIESGSTDENGDGKLDSFIDDNVDGLADLGIPLLGEALPDEDNDNIPDLIDIVVETGGSFGCTLKTKPKNSIVDPTLPFTLFFLLAYYAFGRRVVWANYHFNSNQKHCR